jgi:ribosomal protein L6P/L9E
MKIKDIGTVAAAIRQAIRAEPYFEKAVVFEWLAAIIAT